MGLLGSAYCSAGFVRFWAFVLHFRWMSCPFQVGLVQDSNQREMFKAAQLENLRGTLQVDLLERGPVWA